MHEAKARLQGARPPYCYPASTAERGTVPIFVKTNPLIGTFPDQVMAKDKRPGVAAIFAALYPDEDKVS